MDWCIVIPSYNRVDTLKNKTLSVLKHYKIPNHVIHVFVANEEQKKLYETAVGNDVGKIIVGEKGLAEIRNYIFKYFPKGKQLVCMDDDIKGFLEFDSSKKRHEKPLVSLKSVIQRGFKECEKHGARLWGVYPSPNGFFMKDTVSTDLKFIIGSFWGCINPGSSDKFQIQLGSEKEDYQRTIQFWKEDAAVIRLNFISPKTAYYKEPGGMQEGDRLKKQRTTVKAMLKRWPQYIKMNPRRKSGYPEILLIKHANQTRKKKHL